jgi:hypothetical protein
LKWSPVREEPDLAKQGLHWRGQVSLT